MQVDLSQTCPSSPWMFSFQHSFHSFLLLMSSLDYLCPVKSFIPEPLRCISYRSSPRSTGSETESSKTQHLVLSCVLKLCSSFLPLVSSLSPPSTRWGPGGGRPSNLGPSFDIFHERSTRSCCKE